MSFTEHMRRIVESVPGAVASTVMGFDGVPVEVFQADGADAPADAAAAGQVGVSGAGVLAGVNVTELVTECSAAAGSLLRPSALADDELAGGQQRMLGALDEIAIAAQRLTLLMRPLTDDYFLAVVLGPQGIRGKASFMMRLATPGLLEELS